jgi:hypothetical protein
VSRHKQGRTALACTIADQPDVTSYLLTLLVTNIRDPTGTADAAAASRESHWYTAASSQIGLAMTGSRYRRRKGKQPGESSNVVLPQGGDKVLLQVAADAADDTLLQGEAATDFCSII